MQRTHAHSGFVKAFPARSPRILQRSELTERDWENAVQGLGKVNPSALLGSHPGFHLASLRSIAVLIGRAK